MSFRVLSPLQMQEFWSCGVLTAKTRCWAQGMDGWRPLQAIPQLKWCLLATGQPVMNESDLATLILNMLITMCSYYPSRYGALTACCLFFTLLYSYMCFIKSVNVVLLKEKLTALYVLYAQGPR